MTPDPIHSLEIATRELHDAVGKITQPRLRRYPLLFTFLLTFSAAAILHGFEIATDEIELFHKHPLLLITIGTIALLITGRLYTTLERIP